jgi:hypothetical protein
MINLAIKKNSCLTPRHMYHFDEQEELYLNSKSRDFPYRANVYILIYVIHKNIAFRVSHRVLLGKLQGLVAIFFIFWEPSCLHRRF